MSRAACGHSASSRSRRPRGVAGVMSAFERYRSICASAAATAASTTNCRNRRRCTSAEAAYPKSNHHQILCKRCITPSLPRIRRVHPVQCVPEDVIERRGVGAVGGGPVEGEGAFCPGALPGGLLIQRRVHVAEGG